MRFAVIADSHFRVTSRFAETIRLHDWIAEDIANQDPDFILHTGDVFDSLAGSDPAERAEAWSFFQRLAAIAPVAVVRGNHDELGDLPVLERLQTKHPIQVFETFGTLVLDTKSGPVALALLGWPQRANIHRIVSEMEGETAPAQAADDLAHASLMSILRGFGSWFQGLDPEIPRVLAAHAMVRGARVSSGQPMVGCDFELGLEELGQADADFYALGHIHCGNHWTIKGADCCYPGAPRRVDASETEPKGYVVAEVDMTLCGCAWAAARGACDQAECRNRGTWSWEFVETPAAKMIHVEDEWGIDPETRQDCWLAGMHGMPESVAGAEVRFRYTFPVDKRAAAAAAARATREAFIADGALEVKLEPVVKIETKARAPEVAQAATTEAKLVAYWASKGFDPGPRLRPLLDKLAELTGGA